jgi:hypothetical protein
MDDVFSRAALFPPAHSFMAIEILGIRYLEGFFGLLLATMIITFGYIYASTGPNQLDGKRGVGAGQTKDLS